MWEFIAKTGINGLVVVALFWAGYNYHLIQENVKVAEAANQVSLHNDIRVSVLEANYLNIITRLNDIQTDVRELKRAR